MMGRYTQAGRLMRVKFANLGDDDLLLEKLDGTETISGLFVRPLPPRGVHDSGAVATRSWVRASASRCRCPTAEERRYFHGIVRRLTRGMPVIGPDGDRDLSPFPCRGGAAIVAADAARPESVFPATQRAGHPHAKSLRDWTWSGSSRNPIPPATTVPSTANRTSPSSAD